MSERLTGKKVVVSAAGQGIGRAAALACAQAGASVVATDINAESLGSLATECASIETCVLDVTNREAVGEFATKVGAVDALFNCVGFVDGGSILECTPESWDRSFLINVTSMYDMIRAFLPAMLDSGGGSIVNMSSVASSIKGVPNRFVYGTTKAAVIGLTKSVAADFVKQGIRCNAICPGTVQSPSLDERLRSMGNYEEARAAFIARQPQGRLGTAEEIAALVVYLVSDESGYTTGTTQVIDGGWCI